MEQEKKEAKKGVTYPSSVGGVDYTEYQTTWILKKKLKTKQKQDIEKLKTKYLKYIKLYDEELFSRENENKKKEEATQNAEKALMEQLMKKYNKTTL